MRRPSVLLALLLVGAPFAADAQYGPAPAAPAAPTPPALAPEAEAAAAVPQAATPPDPGGLPPFLAKMQRHDVDVRVVRGSEPAGAGLTVTFRIVAGGARVRDYTASTDAQGVARFTGIPTNPEVQNQIGYEVLVDADGARFPFALDRVPTDGGRIELPIPEVAVDLSPLRLEHGMIELFPDEESLVVRHEMRLFNDGDRAVNLATLPGGGLALPLPEGAKHPDLHDQHDEALIEVRGTNIVHKGVVLPAGSGPTPIRVIYTIPYRSSSRTFAWRQTMPIRASGGMVVVSRDKQPQQQVAVPLELVAEDPATTVQTSELDGGRRFQMLRGDGLMLAAGQPLRFTVKGLPARHGVGLYVLAAAVAAVALFVLFGFRRGAAEGGERLSRAHLEIERDRLLAALRRMRKAVNRGHMTEARFEREREAVNARLVSIFRALDRLDAR